MKGITFRSIVISIMINLLVGWGCRNTPESSPPRYIFIHMKAEELLNPDIYGNPLPLRVRIYQLKDKGKFERAEYHEIQNKDKEVLREHLMAEEVEVTLQPKEDVTIKIEKEPHTEFIGVAGLFREPSGNRWKQILEVQKGSQHHVFDLSFQKTQIAIESRLECTEIND